MKRIFWIVSLVALWPATTSWAQLEPPNEMGVTMGHVHLNVRDVEANKKFFALLGGTPLKIDGTDVMKFPGVFVFLTPGNPPDTDPPPANLQVVCGCPSDGVQSSVINHLGYLVQNIDEYMAKFKAANLTLKGIPGTRRQILVFSPDNLAFEIAEDKSLNHPITQQHFHFFAPAFLPSNPHRVPTVAMFIWYQDNFGAKLTTVANLGAELPGVNLRFSPTPLPTVPTKGRVVDHIGFEVKNLEQFCKKLEASGVKFDQPYSKTRHNGFASAELTDPFGVSVELTEGLNKF
jgi:catechol 2,3-dioxygenase-like lactoylglutathione lyase family enzyme